MEYVLNNYDANDIVFFLSKALAFVSVISLFWNKQPSEILFRTYNIRPIYVCVYSTYH